MDMESDKQKQVSQGNKNCSCHWFFGIIDLQLYSKISNQLLIYIKWKTQKLIGVFTELQPTVN